MTEIETRKLIVTKRCSGSVCMIEPPDIGTAVDGTCKRGRKSEG